MADDVYQKVCPGCFEKRIIRWSKSDGKYLWETHYLYARGKRKRCPYSNRSQGTEK